MSSRSRVRRGMMLVPAALIPFVWTSDVRIPPRVVRNVLIVTLDTTRADVLSAYAGNLVETPAVDRLAREGVVFEQATSAVPLTLPAHVSLFTGLVPPHHGVRDNVDRPLGDSYITLAETLRAGGMRTAAFVGSAVVDAHRGLAQGFDTYSDGQRENRNPRLRRPANVVVDEATEWIARQDTKPFFAWIHLYDAHAPYTLPEPYRTMYEDAPYLGAIAFMDAQLARLLTVLDERHLAGHTLVVVAADHGESLGDHGEDSHGIFVYQSTIRVPLMVRLPGLPARRLSDVVRLVDVMPTVLDVLRTPSSPVDGVSLLPLMMGEIEHLDLEAYAESLYPRRFGWGELRTLRAGRFKFVAAPKPELYDLEKDAAEVRNIYGERKELAALMRATLERAFADSPSTSAPSDDTRPDPETIVRLAALGYVSPTASSLADSPTGPQSDPKDCINAFNAILRMGHVSPLEVAGTVDRVDAAGRVLQVRPGSDVNAASASWQRPFEPRQSCLAGRSSALTVSSLRSASLFGPAHPTGRMPLAASR